MNRLAPDPNDTITINVGGQFFTTRRSTLFRLPHSRLYMVVYDQDSADGTGEFEAADAKEMTQTNYNFGNCANTQAGGCLFFDRDPEIFRYILDYYRTGELHLPHSLCGPFIRKELIFWGIAEEDIEPCCLALYMKYEEERKTKNMLFRDCFEDIEPMKHLVQVSRGFKRWRYKSWLFLDCPTSSLPAKIWAVVLLLMMAVSIITYSLATHPDFRVELRMTNSSANTNTASDSTIENNDGKSPQNVSHRDGDGDGRSVPKQCLQFVNMTEELKRDDKDYRYDCTTPLPELVILDVLLNGVFTLEILLKTLISPDRSRYLKSPTTILEICISTSFWLQVLLTHVTTTHDDLRGTLFLPIRSVIRINEDPESGENALVQMLLAGCNMAQALRVFRIFKLSKISSGLRVLMLTVKKSITELVLLGFLLINGMFLFACLIYLAEYNVKDTFPSIPNALWWAIITITGVGYGDVFPKGGLGYFVGALCAISGCTVTGLAIPIIGHNFNTYYKYMRNYLKEGKYLREIRKERGAFDADYSDRDRLVMIKRKLSRGRSPSASLAVFSRKSSTLVCDNSCNTAESNSNNRSQWLPPRLFRRSQPSNRLPNSRKTMHYSNRSAKGVKVFEADAANWSVDPCRTPNRGLKLESKVGENHSQTTNGFNSTSETLINYSNVCLEEGFNNQSESVISAVDNKNKLPKRAEKRKTLRKLMGNSFDRGFKRPIT